VSEVIFNGEDDVSSAVKDSDDRHCLVFDGECDRRPPAIAHGAEALLNIIMASPALGKRIKVRTVIDEAIDIGSRKPFASCGTR
jgi:hypothetical protein